MIKSVFLPFNFKYLLMSIAKITCGLSFFLLFVSLRAQQTEAYRIEVQPPKMQDSVLFLGRYQGHKTYLVDTAYKQPESSVFVFEGQKTLPTGLYFIANNAKQNLIDLIISEQSHHFTLKAKKGFDVGDVKYVHSKENKGLQAYLKLAASNYAYVAPLQARLPILKAQSSDSVAIIKAEMERRHKAETVYRQKLLKQYTDGYLPTLFHLLSNVEDDPTYIDAATDKDGRLDTLQWYALRKQHYWDHIDLKKDEVLHNPFIGGRIEDYFDNYVLFFDIDSLQTEIDHFMRRLTPDSDMYMYSLWLLLNKYERSNMMGHDAVLVHMADTYFAHPSKKIHKIIAENIVKKANERRPILIGKVAPELKGKDSTLREHALSEIKAQFTVLVFWNPTCYHCDDEMPLLLDFYHKNKEKYGLEVIGACNTPDFIGFTSKLKEWNPDFVNILPATEHFPNPAYNYMATYQVDGTPLLFLLDKDKKIIAKDFGVQHLDMLIQDYLKRFK